MTRVVLRGVGIVAVVALAACSGKASARPASAAPTTAAPSTTSTTDPRVAPVDQVPAVITVEYVQRVMDALDRVEGDLTRKLYKDKVPTPEWRQGLMAIKDRKAFDNAEADYGRAAARDFDAFRNPPGDPTTKVEAIADSSSDCATVRVLRDFGPQFTQKPAPDTLNGIVILRLKDPARDPTKINPTAWVVTADGVPAPGVDLGHSCH